MLSRATTRTTSLLPSPSSVASTIRPFLRSLSTLPQNPHIYIFPHPTSPSSTLLTLLPTHPPTLSLALGTSPNPDPTASPSTFTENPKFLTHLHTTISAHASADPSLQAQAAAMASSGGSPFSSSPNQPKQRNSRRDQPTRSGTSSGAGPTSSQGGAGSGGRGGFIHVYDERAPPDFGRIPEPEDIFGSLEVDGRGVFVDGTEDGDGVGRGRGRYQASGTYRIVTPNGILGLSGFLRGKLVERLREVERGGEGGG